MAALPAHGADVKFNPNRKMTSDTNFVQDSDIDSEMLPGDLAVVVPTYNVGDKLQGVLEGLVRVCGMIVVVDDGSTDGCVDAVRHMPIQLVTFDANRGKGHALLAGYQKALEDREVKFVAVLDADGQHDPAELPKLYKACKEDGADFVIGSRVFDRENVPFRSWFGNVLTAWIMSVLLGERLPDTQSGYRILSRSFLKDVLPSIEGGRYETEMKFIGCAIRAGYPIKSVPIKTIYVDGNATSHFRKVRDSFRIYRTLFGSAIKRGPK